MDIQSAATYMSFGYRIRRSSWLASEYLHDYGGITKHQIHVSHVYDFELKTTVDYFREENVDINALELEDLLANDWEVITVGVRTHFNEFNCVEYNDKIEAPESGWDEE